jgi:hypothetical protein
MCLVYHFRRDQMDLGPKTGAFNGKFTALGLKDKTPGLKLFHIGASN